MKRAILSIFEQRKGEYEPLNGFRGIGIILVSFGHFEQGMAFAIKTRSLPVIDFGPIIDSMLQNLTGVVDMFFVLSGFLISGGLLYSYENKRASYFRNFYIKRALRIFPAYYFFIGVTALFIAMQWSALERSGSIANAKQIEAIQLSMQGMWYETFYLTNFIFGTHPHTWSLATEEHFYALFPILGYFFLFRLQSNARIKALIVMYLAVALFRMALITDVYLETHYLKFLMRAGEHARFDSILVGIILMELYRKRKYSDGFFSKRAYYIALWSGVVLFFAALLSNYFMPEVMQKLMRFHLFNISCGLLFAASLQKGTWWNSFLSIRFFTPLARLSYGIYLWHFFLPNFSLAPVVGIFFDDMSYFRYFAIFLYVFSITFIFCFFTYLLAEYPFLWWKEKLTGKSSTKITA